jgi:hypothetical protein
MGSGFATASLTVMSLCANYNLQSMILDDEFVVIIVHADLVH